MTRLDNPPPHYRQSKLGMGKTEHGLSHAVGKQRYADEIQEFKILRFGQVT